MYTYPTGTPMDLSPDHNAGGDIPGNQKKPEFGETKDNPKKTSPVEKLPLGTGYRAEELPIDELEPEITLTEEKAIPDLVKEAKILAELDEPVPAPEDEFYDFTKDIYGDETEYKP